MVCRFMMIIVSKKGKAAKRLNFLDVFREVGYNMIRAAKGHAENELAHFCMRSGP